MSTPTSVYRQKAIPMMLLQLLSSNMKTLEHKPMFSTVFSRCFSSMIMLLLQWKSSYLILF